MSKIFAAGLAAIVVGSAVFMMRSAVKMGQQKQKYVLLCEDLKKARELADKAIAEAQEYSRKAEAEKLEQEEAEAVYAEIMRTVSQIQGMVKAEEKPEEEKKGIKKLFK